MKQRQDYYRAHLVFLARYTEFLETFRRHNQSLHPTRHYQLAIATCSKATENLLDFNSILCTCIGTMIAQYDNIGSKLWPLKPLVREHQYFQELHELSSLVECDKPTQTPCTQVHNTTSQCYTFQYLNKQLHSVFPAEKIRMCLYGLCM